MKRASITESTNAILQSLAGARDAIAAARTVRQIPRSAFDAAVANERQGLKPEELRRLSPVELERRAAPRVQALALAAVRDVQQRGRTAVVAPRTLLATVQARAKRLLPPDVPSPGKDAGPVESTLWESALVRELRALRQEHQIDRLDRRFRSLTAKQRVDALAAAQASGDDLTSYVLDSILVDELPMLTNDGAVGDAGVKAIEDNKKLRLRFSELEDARLSVEERATLQTWETQLETYERDWRHEADILAAVVHRGSVDVEAELARV